MDVRCNRCGTDYEFDDALISDRGTTVQCTNCGYQFKIYPERTAVTSPERWIVHTMSGRELVYTSLRDLQKAIGEHKVGPKDLLSRGDQPSRPLGSIPELEPFFTSGTGPSRGMQSVPRTLHGVAPPPSGAPRPPPVKDKPTQRGFGLPSGSARDSTAMSATMPVGDFEQQSAPSRVLGEDGIDAHAATERQPTPPPPAPAAGRPSGAGRTAVGLGSGAAAARSSGAPAAKPVATASTVRIEPAAPSSFDSTLPAASPPQAPVGRGGPPAGGRPSPPAGAPGERAAAPQSFDATLPVPAAPDAADLLPSWEDDSPPQPNVVVRPYGGISQRSPLSGATSSSPYASSPRAAPTPGPPPVSTRERMPSYDDLPLGDPVDPARRARSRWMAGVVFIGVVALLGATLGRQYLVRLSTGRKAEPTQRDDRAVRLLQEGVRLIDRADYDGAREQLLKAQALSERDPGVLAALARLEAARADLIWLKLRLLDPTSKDLVQATTRELGVRAAKARQSSDAAFAVAADDPVVIRARIDAMRIAGDEAKAREWIAPIAASASDPENAYVLAALDLAEVAPAFGTVIDRLRSAAVSEHESTRARGALIYALVRAGRVVEAETELAKVTGGPHPHPLVEELKGFVARFSTSVDGGADAEGVPVPSTSAAASAAEGAASPVAVGTPGAEDRAPGSVDSLPAGDFRVRLTQAAQASSSGNLERAAALYQSVLNEQPGNTEALSGLADVARRRGDMATATRLYGKVLEVNPSYLPALMATADAKWSSGDRKGAVVLYKRLLEQAGPSTDYGQRAQARINEAEGSSSGAASPPAAAAAKPTAPATATPTAAPTSETPSPPRSRPDIDTSDLPGVTPP